MKPNINTRFLLVDDDDVNNLISRLTLEAILGEVKSESFTNPREGLNYLETSFLHKDPATPAVLLLDLNMPVMNGWEFLDRFESLPSDVKGLVRIYILSSSVDPRDRERSDSMKNVSGFLVKPLTAEHFKMMFG